MSRFFVAFGSLVLGLGVALGAFGAHGLKHLVNPEKATYYIDIWHTAVEYQFLHGMALLIFAALADKICPRAYRWASIFSMIGMLIFSGSLYTIVLLDSPRVGMITPIGGVCLIASWFCFFIGTLLGKKQVLK
ncbi:DUF423 domain-containing protein [Basilea psittacipulmonis]|uniref:DUF423 domain-containing protein n=1 Tax=Basilea psittacipulmonis DSM 24701 TaxID=1072685 RepID=A0A077DGG6_9BURK|nr:DUF423 domain-containing protein [Basilea psittacipulmonis]AIL33226.1 hypothetical protein IX83_07905 [Basilea psittacipulmonis DSM 24701]